MIEKTAEPENRRLASEGDTRTIGEDASYSLYSEIPSSIPVNPGPSTLE